MGQPETVDDEDIIFLCDPTCHALRLFRRDFEDAQKLIRTQLMVMVNRMDCTNEAKREINNCFRQSRLWIQKAGKRIADAREEVAAERAKAGVEEEAEEALDVSQAVEADGDAAGLDTVGLPDNLVAPPPARPVHMPPTKKVGSGKVVTEAEREGLAARAEEQA